MSEQFDPYHKWLGIPLKDQPPNHYRLLGLDLFESDPDVIEAAAFRQTAHVRTYQLGPHSADSQNLLNEIAAAKVCLLDPQKRAAYDTELRGRLRAADGRRSVPPAVAPSQTTEPPIVPVRPVVLAVGQKPAKPMRRKKSTWPVYAGLGAVALLLVVLLAVVTSGPGPDEPADSGQQGATEDQDAGVADAQPPAGSAPGVAAALPSEDKPPVQQQAQRTLPSPEQDQPSPPEEAAPVTPSPPADAAAIGETPRGDLKPDESPAPQIATVPPLPPDAEDQLKEELAQAKTPQNFQAIADKALRYVDRAIAGGDAETAKKLVAWALAAARESTDAELSKTAALRYLELQTPLTEDVIAAAKKRLGTWKPTPAVGPNESQDPPAASVSGSDAPQRSLADLLQEDAVERGLPEAPASAESASRVPAPSALSEGDLKPPSGAILLMTFESDTLVPKSGRVHVKNLSGAGHIGEMHGAKVVPGMVGKGLEFDGNSSVMVSGRFPSGGSPRTISAWILSNSQQGCTVLFYGIPTIGRAFGFITWGGLDNGEWAFLGYGCGLPTGMRVDANWHHHVVSYDGTYVEYYFDAERKLRSPARNVGGKREIIRLDTAPEPMRLGVPLNETSRPFIGRLDELAVFDRVLSAQEVQMLYKMGVQGVLLAK